jgi:ankyrin repeat protein
MSKSNGTCNCILIFDDWLKSNRHLFNGHEPVFIRKDKYGYADYRFEGITKQLTLSVKPDGRCIVSVDHNNLNIDHFDFDVYPTMTRNRKYFDSSFLPGYRRYYDSIKELFINQCCKYLAKWAKEKFKDSSRLLMVEWGGGSSYAKILDLKTLSLKGNKNRNDNELFEVVNVVRPGIDEVSSIQDAAYTNEIAEVRMLLKAGVDPNAENDEGLNALHFALSHGNMACAKLLMRAGARLNPRSDGAYRALYVAVAHGYIPPVKYLLSKGVNPNKKPQLESKWTPLHIAVTDPGKSYVAITKLLLQHHANPRAKDSGGRTPFDLLEQWKRHEDNSSADIKTYDQRKRILELAAHRSGVARSKKAKDL